MCFSNLIEIPTTNNSQTTGHSTPGYIYEPIHSEAERLTYTAQELMQIRDNIRHDRRYRVLNNTACVNIRELRLNKKRKRGQRSGKQCKLKHQIENNERKVDRNNLVEIPLIHQPKQHKNKIKLLSLNARSVKSKDTLIKDYLTEENADICIISETWLKDIDQAWIDSCDLNTDGYKMLTAHRCDRSGGGLACVYKMNYKVSQKENGQKRSLEYAIWNVRLSDTDIINIIGIYHPPPSSKNASNSVFIDEISKFMVDEILQLENIVILGDFNIRVNDIADNEVIAFRDTLYALGLDQHVNFRTHNQGNTVDLVFTENLSAINIIECKQGPYLSDHCVISCVTSLKGR